MNKVLLTLLIPLFSLVICTAQDIEIKKTYYGYRFIQDDISLTMKEFEQLLEPNSEAVLSFKKAKSSNVMSSILSGVGGFIIGYQLGNAFYTNDINIPLGAVGVGLILGSIPISVNATKHVKHTVELYNSSLNATSYHSKKLELRIVTSGSQIGLSMNF